MTQAPAPLPPPLPATSATGTGGTAPGAASAKARETARQFEAVFVGQMTRLMLESVEMDPQFSGGHGEEMFRGILAEQLGNQIARGRGIGLSDRVLAEIVRLQQGQPVPSPPPAATEAPTTPPLAPTPQEESR